MQPEKETTCYDTVNDRLRQDRGAYQEKKINVEEKSLNSKLFGLTTRIAPLYREMKMEIRQMIAVSVVRGKEEFAILIEKDAPTDAAPLNTALMENYLQQLRGFADKQQPLAGLVPPGH